MTGKAHTLWTFAITSIALFMVSLDNLVVTTALPVIRTDLGASLEQLEWTVNAYTLTFAVFLLSGAALGDGSERRRVFAIGLVVFTLGSAPRPSPHGRGAEPCPRGSRLGGAIVMPLTLTLLSAAVSPEKRGPRARCLGWHRRPRDRLRAASSAARWWRASRGSGSSGSTCRSGSSSSRSHCGARREPQARPASPLDLPGMHSRARVCSGDRPGGSFAERPGWGSHEIVGSLDRRRAPRRGIRRVGAPRAAAPMLPMRFFRSRGFALANTASFLMFFRDLRLDLPAGAVLPDSAGSRRSACGLGSCPGPSRRCSSRRSPGRSRTRSARS